MKGSSRVWSLVYMGVLLLAFALRVYHLDYQSFWSDEGISVLRSALPLPEMMRQMPVEHVPGYFVLLHFWLPLTAQHDYALRFLSVWPSVLAVALTARLAWDLGRAAGGALSADWGGLRHGIALGAALLMTTSAFQIWYAQEARMYSWLLAAALAATLLLWRLLEQPDERTMPWITMGYALTTALAIYLHYYGFLVPLAHTLFMVGWLVATRNWRIFGYWVASGLAVVLLFAPWFPRALAISGFGGWREAGDPWQIPARYLTAYTTSEWMSTPWGNWLPWLYLVLALLGSVGWWRRRPTASLFLLTNLLAPLGAVLWMALRNPDFHERYLIAVTGPLLILVAGSGWLLARNRWRDSRGAIGAAAVVLLTLIGLACTNIPALDRVYHDESIHKPNFREAAARIAQHEQPGDVILVDGPDPQKVFLHYYRGDAPVHDLRPLLDASGEEVEATLTAAIADGAGAWELLYFHAPAAVQHWMATRTWSTAPSDHNDIRVTLYGLPHEPAITNALDVAFGPDLTLARAEIDAPDPAPGDLLRVTTHWQVQQPLPDYKFSLRLQDAAGTVVLADDYVPANWFAPTSTWPVGDAIDRRGLLLPDHLPPGPYRVTLRLYDPSNGVAVETENGPDVVLGDVTVE